MGYYPQSDKTKFCQGVEMMLRVVGSTMGPGGNPVLECAGLDASYRRLIRDGKETLKLIQPNDPEVYEPIARMKDVAEAVVRRAGDATSTATVILGSAFLHIEKTIKDHPELNRSRIAFHVRQASKIALAELEKRKLQVTTSQDLENVATICAAGDREIGFVIGSMIEKIGADGTVKVEYHDKSGVEAVIVPGYKFQGGVYGIDQYNGRRGLELDNPRVVVVGDETGLVDYKMDVAPILAEAQKFGDNRPLVVFVLSAEGSARATLLRPFVKGADGNTFRAPVWLVRIGAGGVNTCADISAVTGATLFGKLNGKMISKIKDSDFGEAASVVATTESVTIVSSDDQKASVRDYVNRLEASISEHPELEEKTRERIAAVTGGVGLIRVPASTQSSGFYYQEVVDDAWRATRAAINGGVLPGGGAALSGVAEKLFSIHATAWSEEALVYDAIAHAFYGVLKTVCDNAGFEVDWGNIEFGYGKTYDIVSGEMNVSALECGVIDSAPAIMAAVELALAELALWVNSEYLLVQKFGE